MTTPPTGPTIDGLAPEQLFDLCEQAALTHIQSDCRHAGLPDIPPALLSTVRAGVAAGILALWNELGARGLIVERP